MKNRLHFFTVALLFLIVVNTPAKAQRKPAGKAVTPTHKVDIYLAGYIHPEGKKEIAAYTKNGVPVMLTDGQEDGEVRAITVVNGDVYAVGLYNGYPKYWKNGTEMPIANDGHPGMAADVAVYKGDVYIAGYVTVKKNRFDNVGFSKARLWKNGQRIPLEITEDDRSEAFSLAIDPSNGDVYVGGADQGSQLSNIRAGGKNEWQYWKNGLRKRIINNPIPVLPYSMVFANNEIYVGGWAEYNNGKTYGFKKTAAYWSNSTGTVILTENSPEVSKAYAIAVSGKNVYAAGFDGEKGTYWKNGVEGELGDVTNFPNEFCVAADGNDFYVAGLVSDAGQNASYRLWKNGQMVDKNINMKINDMVVVHAGSTAIKTAKNTATPSANLSKLTIQMPPASEPAGPTPQQEAQRFLAENKLKPGVITTPSGLQYEIISKGSGPQPTINGKARFHVNRTTYVGAQIKNQDQIGPTTQIVANVMPGLSEGLQLMNVGSKYKLIIPPHLGNISPGLEYPAGSVTMIWEVELLGVD